MAQSLTALQVACTLQATLQNAIDGAEETATVPQGRGFSPSTALSNGTAAYQADRIWGDKDRTLLDTVSENLDMYDLAAFDIGAGAGRDALGQVQTLKECVGLLIVNSQLSVGNLIVGGEGSAAAWNSPFNGSDTAVITVFPGGFFALFAPTDPAYDITDTTNHLLKFLASGGDVTFSPYGLFRSL